jgi:hypothetical protein
LPIKKEKDYELSSQEKKITTGIILKEEDSDRTCYLQVEKIQNNE